MSMPTRFVNTEAAEEAGEVVGFSFGENWAKYLNALTDSELQHAKDSLQEAFASEGIDGRRFLDLGSGSGLFSYAAHSLGSRTVVSIDVDPNSIACTAFLRKRAGDPATWAIAQGSVLDPEFLAGFEPVDRLYSWGVLHHTGAMWQAFDAALALIAPGGSGCIALYNRPRRPRLHMALKRTYNRLPRVLRPLMTALYGLAQIIRLSVTGQNPITHIRNYGQTSRGMSFWRDLEDWLGGLPYEFAEPAEVQRRATQRGLTVLRSVVAPAGSNNEYLISRPE